MSNLVNIITLYKEIRNIKKKDIFNGEASVEPISEDDPLLLRVLLTPKDGLFAMAKISIKLTIPIDYPNSRPSVIFETKMFHPNVDYLTGIPCFSMLRQDWNNGYLLEHYISGLLWFLHNPCFLDPSNPVVANHKAEYPELLKKALRGETVLGLKYSWARVDEPPKKYLASQIQNNANNTNIRRFSNLGFITNNRIVQNNVINNNNAGANPNPVAPIHQNREIDTTPTSSVRQLRSMFENLSRN
jgi:peroxin-4